MRVLHVGCHLDPLGRSGAELLDAWPTLTDVAAAVKEAGAEILVLQSARKGEILEHRGVTVHFVAEPAPARIPGTRGSAGILPWRLASAAAAWGPDVVQVNGLGFPLHTRALARIGRPLVVRDHGDSPSASHPWLRRWGLARVNAAIFTAREQADPFLDAGALSRSVPIFEAPESSSRFTPGDVRAARVATGMRGDPAVLWVGRLDENKDPFTAIEAFARAAGRLPDPQLWCCYTDAPLLPRIRRRLDSDPDLARRVHLLGAVNHARVRDLCRAADFLISSSRRESTGYAVLEGLACGATPILSDIPAFRALTARGAVGALAPIGRPIAFARAIETLAAQNRVALRQRAVRHFRQYLSFEALGARLAKIYQEVVTAPARSGAQPAGIP